MLRAVADTNIYISAALFGGVPEQILSLARSDYFELFISPAIEREITAVLRKKFGWQTGGIEKLKREIRSYAYKTVPRTKINAVRDDVSDNRILECAVAAYANIIVSGDRHLLRLKHFENIEIMTARNFLDHFDK